MRYDPRTDNAIANERAMAESDARFKAAAAAKRTDSNRFWAGRMLRNSLAAERLGVKESRQWQAFLELSHAIVVAEQFRNFAEARRLGAQLIADRY